MDQAERVLAAAKADLRLRVRRRRAARPASLRARQAVQLSDVVLASRLLRDARTVACYASLATEPGTVPLRSALAEAGVRVLLPVLAGTPGPVPLDWAVDHGVLAPGPLGILQPAGPRLGAAAVGGVDVLLVPALLVDTDGRRLGQGGGHYDATLAALDADVPVVALVHDDELVDAALAPVPTGPLDRPVTAVATPSRWVDVRH